MKKILAFLAGLACVNLSWSQELLRLDDAVRLATDNDLWLTSNRHSQDSVEAKAVVAGTLPDPKVTVALANIPTDSFEFNQEPMTQFKVDVAQIFPRGNTLALKRQELEINSAQFPLLRADREAKVTATVTQLWLDGYKAQSTIALIDQDRSLFEQLVDVAQASYSSTVRRARQQDIIRAELELTQLEDRLTVLHQQLESSKQQLREWLPAETLQREFSRELPSLSLPTALTQPPLEVKTIATLLLNHPSTRVLETQIELATTSVELAKQAYKPEWGVMASYGYRDDAPTGLERADFLSLGVTFDLPLFTGNRQDKQLRAAASTAEAIKTNKLLHLKMLVAQFSALQVKYARNNERRLLYENKLTKQIQDQAEAALVAYTNDDGDFAEVVRARIAELNTNIEMLNIRVEERKIVAQLNYLLAGNE